MTKAEKRDISAAQKDTITKRCTPEIYNPQTTPWDSIRDRILSMERAHFGDESFSEERLQSDFSNPTSTVILLYDTTQNTVVGFTYAVPTVGKYTESFHPERNADQTTAYICDTVLDPHYVGHHLVGKMIKGFEDALKVKGYEYIDRDAAVTNNYATNIAKNYAGRIVATDTHGSTWGDQVYFRIRL